MKMEERDRIIREEGIALGRKAGHSEGRSEGLIEGRLETIQSFIRIQIQKGTSEAELLSMLQECFQLDNEEASQLIHS